MKNTADQSAAKGMPLNISGRVTNMSEAPSVGSSPALKTAGNMTRPASTATSSVSSDTSPSSCAVDSSSSKRCMTDRTDRLFVSV